MFTNFKKYLALPALVAVPALLVGTAAQAAPQGKAGDWLDYGSRDRHVHTDRCNHSDGGYSNVDVVKVRRGYRDRKVCKRPVAGVGYGRSKSLARANAVQAWSRESRSRHGRTYRLRDSEVISAIRCQFNDYDGRRYTNRRHNRRLDLPGEVGNPNHRWNCTVKAKPCRFKRVVDEDNFDGPRWKRGFCRKYAQRSVRQQRRNIRLGCEYRGPRWHRNFRRHKRQCMRTPMFRNFRVIMRHNKQLRRCR